MSSTLVTLLPVAIGFALSPAAIIELILVLFSKRRIVNGVVFVVSLIVLTTLALVIGALGASASGAGSGSQSTIVSVVLAAFGLLLLALGIQNWRKRDDTSEPAAFAAIAGMGPGPVAFLTLGVTFVNPKNLPLLLGAGAVIGKSDSPLVSGIVFVLVGTLPYTGAVLYSLLGGEGASRRLESVREWMVRHNRMIMAILCTLLGVLLLVKGAGALL